MYYIPIYLKCGIYVGYFSFYDFMWDTCGIDIFIVRICMWDKCGIGEKSKSFLGLWEKMWDTYLNCHNENVGRMWDLYSA